MEFVLGEVSNEPEKVNALKLGFVNSDTSEE